MTTTLDALAPEDAAAVDGIRHPPAGAVQLRMEGHAGAHLAKTDPDLVRGVAVLKPGTFNGSVVITPEDIPAYVSRFEALRGILRPPMRLDHSTNVTSVIGRFESLRVEDRPDPTNGDTPTPYLVGDFRLVGTAQEKATYREWIASGKLDERSSELWPYRTNAGAEYPSVFAGAAFVDIPAVEGLGGITLRRDTLAVDRTDTEGADNVADDQDTTDPTDLPDGAEQPTLPDPDEEQPGDVEPEAPAVEDDQPLEVVPPEPVEDPEVHDGRPAGEVPPTDLRALLTSGADPAAVLLALDREVEARVALRVEADTRVANLRTAGVLVPRIAAPAEALLRHADQAVRDQAHAILSSIRPAVQLNRDAGTRTSVAPGGARDGQLIALSMTPEEVAAVWERTDLTSDQRTQLRAEYRSWQDARTPQD